MRVVVLLLSLVAGTSFADPPDARLTAAPPQRLARPHVKLDGLAIGGAVLLGIGGAMAVGSIIAASVPTHATAGCDVCGLDSTIPIAVVGIIGTLVTLVGVPTLVVGMKDHATEQRALYVDRVSPLGIGGRF